MDAGLRARLAADVRAGKGSASAICRKALAAYYNAPPTPPDHSTEIADLRAQVAALADQVAQLARLTAELDALRAENARLQVWLLSATYGNGAQRKAATQHAAVVLAALTKTGNGGNGHE